MRFLQAAVVLVTTGKFAANGTKASLRAVGADNPLQLPPVSHAVLLAPVHTYAPGITVTVAMPVVTLPHELLITALNVVVAVTFVTVNVEVLEAEAIV